MNMRESLDPPWIFRINHRYKQVKLDEAIILDGMRMRNIEDFFDEMTRSFDLPDYFGRNFNALDECLTDLSWLQKEFYIVYILNGECILHYEAAEKLNLFIDTMKFVGCEWSKPIEDGENWDRPAIPFHTLIHCNNIDGISPLHKLPIYSDI